MGATGTVFRFQGWFSFNFEENCITLELEETLEITGCAPTGATWQDLRLREVERLAQVVLLERDQPGFAQTSRVLFPPQSICLLGTPDFVNFVSDPSQTCNKGAEENNTVFSFGHRN